MSGKYGNPCAIYNIPLNTNENDIFRIGCAHLYHFLHTNVKTDDCKPMVLKMHLELDSPSSIAEAEERSIEHNNSITGLRQSVQQLEVEIKALKDALLQAKKDDAVNRIDTAPDVDNNAAQELNSNKEANNGNNLKGEHLELDDSPSSSIGEAEERNIEHNSSSNAMRQFIHLPLSGEHNDTENVVSASEIHHTNNIPKEKQEVFDLRRNCVYIQDFRCSDSSLKMAFRNIRKLANEMKVQIPDDFIIYIDVDRKSYGNLDYYVYFRNADIKEKFLKNTYIYAYNPWTRPLRIFDYNYWGIVDIKNVQSSDLSLETAYVNLRKMAEKMKILRIADYIYKVDVFGTSSTMISYSIQFKNEFMRQQFLRKKDEIKRFPETEDFEIFDMGGHRVNLCILNNNISMTVASACVIGVAKLIGLSLATHDFKRIYVLHNFPHYDDRGFSLICKLSSKQVKNEFLKKKHKLKEKEHLNSIKISYFNAKQNIVLIKYKDRHVATAISFIGLAKQLGCSLNPDQIQHFFDLSEFIDKTYIQDNESN